LTIDGGSGESKSETLWKKVKKTFNRK